MKEIYWRAWSTFPPLQKKILVTLATQTTFRE